MDRCCFCAAHDQLSKKIGVTPFQQEIRRLALSSAARLEQRARVLFGFKKSRGHGVLASWSWPSTVPAKDSDAPLAAR